MIEDCEALVSRLPVEVETVDAVAGVCVLGEVRWGVAPATWRAARVTLGGDVDALPDALPRRLSGGVTGLMIDPVVEEMPGLAWLMRQQAHPGMSLGFDATSEGGVLRVNAFRFAMDETNELTLTARIAGVPEVWPVDPVAVAAITVQALDVEIAFDGMFEALLLLPLGSALLDLTVPAEPQVAALRTQAEVALDGFAAAGQAEAAAEARAFVDALPHPRGVLELRLGGRGIAALQTGAALAGGLTPDFAARVAEAAELELFWTPDAP
ncbi:hypothetical protein [Jannaschia marina]|uniref:hypothetical protein n=1 Tax=Jannaschia marina TaxID=2741674 RepID=UPI0015C896AC|nr:hypothetical protein [Jannaschia marina]